MNNNLFLKVGASGDNGASVLKRVEMENAAEQGCA